MIEKFAPVNTDRLPSTELESIGILRRADINRAIAKAPPRIKQFLSEAFNAESGELTFDQRAGQYRDGSGKLASSIYLQEFVALARGGLSNRLEQATERLLNGRISLREWERIFAEELKDHHLIMLLFAFGGIELLQRNPSARALFTQTGENTRGELLGLSIFAAAIASGLRTAGQILGYSRYKANSVRGAFERSRQSALIGVGYNEARRSLDPTARHCANCPAYETVDWVGIDDVVPVGHACDCNGYCRCRVEYRFNPQRALQTLGSATLADAIARQKNAQDSRF